MSKYQSYKETVLQYSQRLSQNRYTVGTGGNISLLIEGENAIAITPPQWTTLASTWMTSA